MNDYAGWLTAAMDAAERDARAADDGPWEADGGTVHRGHPTNSVVDYCGDNAEHIARQDPQATLRRIAANRKLIADLQAERHLVVDGDCWYTCAAATEERDGEETCDDDRLGKPCDCGRDARVERRLRIIAEGYGGAETT